MNLAREAEIKRIRLPGDIDAVLLLRVKCGASGQKERLCSHSNAERQVFPSCHAYSVLKCSHFLDFKMDRKDNGAPPNFWLRIYNTLEKYGVVFSWSFCNFHHVLGAHNIQNSIIPPFRILLCINAIGGHAGQRHHFIFCSVATECISILIIIII